MTKAVAIPIKNPITAIVGCQLEVLKMPRRSSYERNLPPAVIDVRVLRLIDGAIPDDFHERITWEAIRRRVSISESSLDKFLSEISEEFHIDEFNIEVLGIDSDNVFTLQCNTGGNDISYVIPEEEEGPFATLASALDGIFRQNSRWTARIPSPIRSYLPLHASKLALGAQHPSFWAKLNWSRITEDIISRVAAHLATFLIGGIIGFLLGYFLSLM